ncbi:dihydrofolate reductase family protein [Helcobacillus sp. ACRRO]|uniref:dihydrofolate reductase family protein n=1 Tax=Helcobacillus TaxID=1161125 RepID=UPI001EF5B1E8|nr:MULTISPECIES: dihydrofolate reductase family protein [Helcobacillus]MCG7426635.1 dihydrofolate reductase family protein [Helcobacillus sp. ACRRO]MDK7742856.1 dihydrofolate reductase family protein [Helcobacillus massiliensis]WOO94085.1 dihydrofolate reductase family protein [Helcobacillus massiliensis]
MTADGVQKDSVHMVLRDGAFTDGAAATVPMDDAGAEELADLYQFDPERTTVRVMMNSSVDGSATGADGTSASLGNPTDFFNLVVLRAMPDVIVAGAETVRAEDYKRPGGRKSLRSPSRRPSGTEFPALVVLTGSGDLGGAVDPSWPTLLATSRGKRDAVIEASGFPTENVVTFEEPLDLIEQLAQRGWVGIQVEGGPSVNALFLEADAVDELCVSTSHVTVGGEHTRIVRGAEHDAQWQLSDMLVGRGATLHRYVRDRD